MKNQVLSSIALSTLVATAPVWAAGSHGHDHGADDSKSAESDHESSVGSPAKASMASHEIQVTTLDAMKFEFAEPVQLKPGQAVTFKVTNAGKINHEFSIGDKKEQDAHRAMMRKMPDMIHEDGNTITLKLGETRTLTWKFSDGGEVVFACNIPGHYEAGMHAEVTIK